MCRLLALQVCETLDVRVLLADDQHSLGGNVGFRERVFLLAGLGDADLVDDGVVTFGIKPGNQAIPLTFNELGLDAELLCHGFTDFDVETDELVGRIMESEWSVGAFGADLDDACGLDLVKIFASKCWSEHGSVQGCGGCDCLEPAHGIPFRIF